MNTLIAASLNKNYKDKLLSLFYIDVFVYNNYHIYYNNFHSLVIFINIYLFIKNI